MLGFTAAQDFNDVTQIRHSRIDKTADIANRKTYQEVQLSAFYPTLTPE